MKDFFKKAVDKLKKWVYSCLASKARGKKTKEKKIRKSLDKQAKQEYNTIKETI